MYYNMARYVTNEMGRFVHSICIDISYICVDVEFIFEIYTWILSESFINISNEKLNFQNDGLFALENWMETDLLRIYLESRI